MYLYFKCDINLGISIISWVKLSLSWYWSSSGIIQSLIKTTLSYVYLSKYFNHMFPSLVSTNVSWLLLITHIYITPQIQLSVSCSRMYIFTEIHSQQINTKSTCNNKVTLLQKFCSLLHCKISAAMLPWLSLPKNTFRKGIFRDKSESVTQKITCTTSHLSSQYMQLKMQSQPTRKRHIYITFSSATACFCTTTA